MKATPREIIAWFVAHVIWWAASAFVIFPFIMSPLYASLFSSGTPASIRQIYITVIGLVVAAVGWCVGLAIFLAMRGNAAASNAPPTSGASPILGPGR